MNNFRCNLLLIIMLVFMMACSKDNLPKATQKGKNTFGCRVDGVLFKPYFTGGLFNTVRVLSVSNSRNFNLFSIDAQNQETSQDVGIEFPYMRKTGTYQLRQYGYRGIYSAGYRDPGWYTTDSVYKGELTLTRCDTINKIYSGGFYFTAIDPNTGRVVKITDGRFDLKE